MNIILLYILVIPLTSSQRFIWSWMSGSSEVNQAGSYTVKGSPSPNVFPGARYGISGALHPFTNHFVTFGGYSNGNYWNDLWSFDATTSQWTWVSGSSTSNQPSVYGTKGIASSTNMPGGRYDYSADIHPVSALFVMFGGWGYDSGGQGRLNDLWIFNFNNNQWTWISGNSIANQAGIYGTKGLAASTNVPGGRSSLSLTIHPQTGYVLVSGGYGYVTSSLMWTWLSGSSTEGQTGVYGTMGVASNLNVPGCRSRHSSTVNINTKNLLIFGGQTPRGNLNDLWSFNFNTNQWTWLSGSSLVDQVGAYGTRGVSSPDNVPGARYLLGMIYLSGINSIILFAGSNSNNFNDIWLFSLSTSSWTWVAGSSTANQLGVYGTKGLAGVENAPGGRYSFAFKCSEAMRKCFLLGGNGYGSTAAGYLNDLWILEISLTTSSTLPFISSTPTKSSSTLSMLATTVGVGMTSNSPSSSTASTVGSDIIPYTSSLFPVSSEVSVEFSEPDSISESIIFIASPPRSSIVSSSIRSTTKKQTMKGESNLNFFQINQLYFIYAAIASVFLLVSSIAIKYLYCRPKPKVVTKSKSKSNISSSTLTTMTTRTVSSTYSNMSTSSIMTKVSTTQGLSIPGFLQFKFGEDFRIRRETARGGMGSVSLGDAINPKLKWFGDLIIVKQMTKLLLTDKDTQLFHQEIALMYFLREQRNIAKIVGYSEKPFCLLMKFYPHGSLENWIYMSNYRNKRLIFSFLTDISRGVECLHSKDLAHCDLKPQNVLLDHDQMGLFCGLTDFGITQLASDKNILVKAFQVVNVRGASLSYAAPEAIMRLRHRLDVPGRDLFKCDVYAIGVTIYEILNRVYPWLCN